MNKIDKNKQKMKELVETFDYNIEQYKSKNYDEANTRVDFIDKFFECLDWDVRNTENLAEQYRQVVREDKVKIQGKQKAPDYSFRIYGQRKFFVEAKKPSVNIYEDSESAYQVRRYGYTAKLPLSILTNFDGFAIYDTRIKPNKNDKSSIARINYYTYKDYAANFDELYNLFSINSILKGSFDKYVIDTKNKRGTGEVDKEFLKVIDDWRLVLARNIALRNKELTIDELNYAIQKIIDRIIFLRISEDRKTEEYKQLYKAIDKENSYKSLDKVFRKAFGKYNSSIFQPEDFISNLKIDDNTLKSIIKEMYYPDCPYEFSVLPIEILGNIYEQFLGKTIRLTASHQAKIEEKPEVKKAGGVYYTPQYIVDYIVKNTIGEKLNELSKKSRTKDKLAKPEDIQKLKILDPSCGSGSFLIGAYGFLLDYHLNYYTANKTRLNKAVKQGKIYQISSKEYKLTIKEKQNILRNNIFGVDIDRQAVEVTKLSLLLKLMEDEREEYFGYLFNVDTAFKLLPDLSDNIKCGNSLISSDIYDTIDISEIDDDTIKSINPFDWEDEFKEIMSNGGFDCVIGNPPYVVLKADDNWLSYLKDKYKVSKGGKVNLYKIFIEKGFMILTQNGMFGYICPNNYISSRDSFELRKLLIEQTQLIEIIEYSESDKIFLNVTQALTTIIFKKNKENDNHTLSIFLKKHGKSNPYQNEFFNNDKFEFIFHNKIIKKMKKEPIVLDNIINGFQGEINVSLNKHVFREQKLETYLPLIRGNIITNYYLTKKPKEFCPISCDKRDHWKIERIVFQEVSNQEQKRRIKAVIINKDYLCGHTTNYCFLKPEYNLSLKFVLSLLNSKIVNYHFSYFNKTNHVPIGEIKKIPIPALDLSKSSDKKKHDELVSLVDNMLDTQKKLHSAKTEADKKLYQKKADVIDKKIDSIVYELYGLTDEEIKIVEEGV